MHVLPEETLLENRYVLRSVVGQGGFAVVYLAHDLQMNGARVAIKQFNAGNIAPDDLPAFKEQFLQEALILRDLHHSRIPRVYGCFEQLDTLFLVMDFVEGVSLRQVAGPSLPVHEALRYAYEVAETLAYLHAQTPYPVIHKDLKPGNVILTQKGCVLLDFGISKAAAQDGSYATRTVMRGLGTDGYAAPEVYNGTSSAPSVDLYALGATLYTLLTGQAPVSAMVRQQQLFNGTQDPLVPPSHFRSDLPESVSLLVRRMLVLQLAQRFPSALEVLQALHACLLECAPPVAAPPLPAAPGAAAWPSPAQGPPGHPAAALAALAAAAPATPTPAASAADSGRTTTPDPSSGAQAPPQERATPVLAARPEDVISPEEMQALIAGSGARLRNPRKRWRTPLVGAVVVAALAYAGTHQDAWLGKATSAFGASQAALTRTGTNAAGAVEYTTPDGSTLVAIPAGTYTIGSSTGSPDQKPAHSVTLPGFYIAKTPVTNAQMLAFIKATNGPAPTEWKRCADWGNDAPAVGLSYADAVAYCHWAKLRLPTEAEWEVAARGPRSRQYPWGDSWDINRVWYRANSFERARTVGVRPLGASPFGVLDMTGSVQQWCSSSYRPYPYRATDGREGSDTAASRVVRGGSWNDEDPAVFRCAYRRHQSPSAGDFTTGFRVARSL